MSEVTETAPYVLVEVEGGLIHNISSNVPDVNVIVVDTDLEGASPESVTQVTVGENEFEAVVTVHKPIAAEGHWEDVIRTSFLADRE